MKCWAKKLTYRLIFISQTAYYRAFSMLFKEFLHRPAAWKHPKSLTTIANINWTMNEIERKYFHLINSIWIGLKFPSQSIQRICCFRWMFTQKESFFFQYQHSASVFRLLVFVLNFIFKYLLRLLSCILCHSTILSTAAIALFKNHIKKFTRRFLFYFWRISTKPINKIPSASCIIVFLAGLNHKVSLKKCS